MNIQSILPENRPRERLECLGPAALSDAELLAIILGSGRKGENAIDLSNRLLSSFRESLPDCSLGELRGTQGIGFAKACQVVSLFEFCRRRRFPREKRRMIRSSRDVFEHASSLLEGAKKEHFMVMHLDTRNCVVKEEVVSIGTLNSSLIHPREVFKSAIKESANAIILVHNHPSGDPEPSPEDREITEQLMEAGEMLKIDVVDHVIIGRDSYYSFLDHRKR